MLLLNSRRYFHVTLITSLPPIFAIKREPCEKGSKKKLFFHTARYFALPRELKRARLSNTRR